MPNQFRVIVLLVLLGAAACAGNLRLARGPATAILTSDDFRTTQSARTGSSAPVLSWNKTYGGTGSDLALTVVQTEDGGYAVAGRTDSFGAGLMDFWLIQTDASGNHLWNQTYGGPEADLTMACVQTADGGYALAGPTYSFGAGGGDFWLVKTDAFGHPLWNHTYGGPREDRAYAVIQTADGGYAVAGGTKSFGAGSTDFWLVKTDANGNPQWNKTYGGVSLDDPLALLQTAEGGYVLAGRTGSLGAGMTDFWLVRTDAGGNPLWSRTYGGVSDDRAYAVVQTADEGYVLAGFSGSYGAGGGDLWLIRTDGAGTPQWNKTHGGHAYDSPFTLVPTADGGYALTGLTYSFGAGNSDAWLVKTDAAGELQWNQTYGGPAADFTGSLVQTSDGGYALAGATASIGAGSDDIWLIRTAREATTITVPDDYATIQDAVDNAIDDDVIFVRTGTYHEHVVVTKPVTLLGEDRSATIVDGNGTGRVLNVVSDNVSVTGFTVQRSGSIMFPDFDAGISLTGTNFCTIAGNRLVDNGCFGVHLLNSHQCVVSGNTFTNNTWYAIDLTTSSNNTVASNTMNPNPNIGVGMHTSSQNNAILNNTILNSIHGIDAAQSSFNLIAHNRMVNSTEAGIWIQDYATNNLIRDNNVTDGHYGIKLEGHANNNTISDNRIGNCLTGLQLYDSSNFNLVHENNITRCSDGIDINEQSTQNTVSKNTITDNEVCGLQVYNAQNNLIDGNTLRNNWAGIGAHGKSQYNRFNGNRISNCTHGILLHDSDYNLISQNNITNCEIAVHFEWLTNFNTAKQNDISDNHIGVQLEQTSGNVFCHNNILANTLQVAIIEYASDTWDDSYPSGGNYWSTYTDVDAYRGKHQNETGSDGVWDQPYLINADNQDRHPLTHPVGGPAGDVDNDRDVDHADITQMANVYGVAYPSPRYDRRTDVDLDGDIDLFDVVQAAVNYGTSW